MKGKSLLILSFIFSLYDASGLNLASKIPLKSIKSPDGDTIDCVDIYHQPAFDHPLLKNHTIFMRPSYIPILDGESKMFNFTTDSQEDSEQVTQPWQLNGECPDGTIPIIRTKKQNFLRASSIKSIPHQFSAHTQITDGAKHEHAVAYVRNEIFYGATATINAWKPQVQSRDEHSLAGIWITGGFYGLQANGIQAGWMVSPGLFRDSNARLFTYWTTDSYNSSGCYNLLCSGFVQVSKTLALGAAIHPTSTYHGSQYIITISMWKDQKTDAWWLAFGKYTHIGYWPASLFTTLAATATGIQWGGEVISRSKMGQHTTTQMGSGHFAEEGFRGASYFRDLRVLDNNNVVNPPDELGNAADSQNCYNIKVGHSKTWGDFFYYGGPGKNPKCP
nr:uncharacterized protein LOC113728501 [Coffea arabica]